MVDETNRIRVGCGWVEVVDSAEFNEEITGLNR